MVCVEKGINKSLLLFALRFCGKNTHAHRGMQQRHTHTKRKEEKAHNFGFIFLCVDKCKLFIFYVNHLPWLLRYHIGCVKKRSLRRINPCWKITSRYIFQGLFRKQLWKFHCHYKPGDFIILYWLIIPFMKKE